MATITRKLAAIMPACHSIGQYTAGRFTDIVGYTALMGSDEDKAFEILRKNREIHIKFIEKFNGTLIKEMGDGMLAQFDSAADSVHCAIDIQKQASKVLDAKVRIGIHLGDITVENHDVFGDGVNIASRLQSIADPGGIYISEALQKSIRAKSSIQTKYLGELNLKNVDFQFRTYAVQGDGLPVPTSAKIKSLRKISLKDRIFGSAISYIIFIILLLSIGWIIQSSLFQDKPTLLILTPENHTGIDTIPYIITGIHRSLIEEVGKIGEMNIISPYTSRTYNNSGKSLKEMAKETKASYIAQPALSCIGENVCLNFIMTKIGSEEKQIWTEDFSKEKRQIFAMYHQITKEIARKINIVLTPEEEKLLSESRDVDPEAYDAFLRGNYYFEQLSFETIELARLHYEKAIEIDPDWAPPYAEMVIYWRLMRFGADPASVTIPKAYEYLNKAKKYASNSVDVLLRSSFMSIYTEHNWVKGEEEILKIMEINPNNARAHNAYALLLTILKRNKEALEQAELARKLDLLNPYILSVYALTAARVGENEKAIKAAEKALSIAPKQNFALGAIILVNISNGDYRSAFDRMVDWNNLDENVRNVVLNIFEEKGYELAALELARAIEKSGLDDPVTIADLYALSGNHSRAMDFLEHAYEIRNMNLPFTGTSWYLHSPFKVDDPRFQQLLEKMNLPLN